jgi:hypothetical protein
MLPFRDTTVLCKVEGTAADCCVSYAGTLSCDIIPFCDSNILCRVEGAAAGCFVWCAVTRALGSTTVSWPAMAAPASLKDPSGAVLSTGMRNTLKKLFGINFYRIGREATEAVNQENVSFCGN